MKVTPGLADGTRKVQVGCGPHNLLEEWWNVDIRQFNGIDQCFDATQPWPFENCIDFVYAEHFLEHLSFDQAVQFFDQTRSALVENGLIRLSTPSLEWVLKTHFTFQDDRKRRIDETWAINRAFHGWGHKFLYSREVLEELLGSRGFSDMEFVEYGKSKHPHLSNLERHPGFQIIEGYPSVWIVEARNKRLSRADDEFAKQGKEAFTKYLSVN